MWLLLVYLSCSPVSASVYIQTWPASFLDSSFSFIFLQWFRPFVSVSQFSNKSSFWAFLILSEWEWVSFAFEDQTGFNSFSRHYLILAFTKFESWRQSCCSSWWVSGFNRERNKRNSSGFDKVWVLKTRVASYWTLEAVQVSTEREKEREVEDQAIQLVVAFWRDDKFWFLRRKGWFLELISFAFYDPIWKKRSDLFPLLLSPLSYWVLLSGF